VASIRLRFVKSYRDWHGKVRHYLRKPGSESVALPGLVGSAEFMAAYQQAIAGTLPHNEIGATRTRVGSIASMVIGYLASGAFPKLAPASQQQYRRILGRLRAEHGDRSIATLERKHANEDPALCAGCGAAKGRHRDDRAASGQPKQAAHARTASAACVL
jgi:hypothetical protein